MKRKKFFIEYTILTVGALIMMAPFLWMILTSFKGSGNIFRIPPQWIPRPFRWDNYLKVWSALRVDAHFLGLHITQGFLMAFINSVFVSVTLTFGQVLTSAMGAFAFSRLKFKLRDKLFLGYLVTLMIPFQVTMIPTFVLLKFLGWVDTYQGLIVPGLVSAYGTFFLRQFFISIPRDLEDAATIDGCSKLGIFRHVILPLAKPAIATLSIFTFLGVWNDFLWPLVVINSPEKMTLPLMLNSLRGLHSTDWTILMPASVIVVVPVILVYIFNQKFITEGISLTGLKG
jgi:multiple sugar transport system permease protein